MRVRSAGEEFDMKFIKSFLNESYNDNWRIYKESLEKHSSIENWDLFIVTASNEEQAAAYRIQIKERMKNGYLPKEVKFLVIPDPEGKRVGSGGATLNALYEAWKILGEGKENPFRNKRILMIHSGGDSKRIPQYSAFGKLFSKVPRELPDGRFSTLFDEFVIALSGLPSRMKDGVVIASGDVLLVFNHNQIDLSRQGAVGIGIKAKKELGQNHGVYLQGENSRAKKFLHKMSVERLQEEGAVKNDMVSIDTGLLWLDSNITYKLMCLITENDKLSKAKYNEFVNEKVRLNFYGDFLIPLTEEKSMESYLKEECEGEYCEELLNVRRKIWNSLKEETMYVQALSPAKFIHFGTTSEFKNLVNEINDKYDYLPWNRQVCSFIASDEKEEVSSINSYIKDRVTIEENVLIEDSIIGNGVTIKKGALLSNVELIEEKEIGENLVLHQLPVSYNGKNGYITRVYGVYDNPKNILNSKNATFLNDSLKDFLTYNNLKEEDFWKSGVEKSLWNMKLFPFFENKNESIEFALKLSSHSVNIKEWVKRERFSLKESYLMADGEEIIRNQNKVEDLVKINNFIREVLNEKYVKKIIHFMGNSEECVVRRLKETLNIIEDLSVFERAKIYRALAEVVKKYPNIERDVEELSWRSLEEQSFNLINEEIQRVTLADKLFTLASNDSVITEIAATSTKSEILKGKVVVEADARINFGGGWSDTPPYSIEKGGTVLNVAITLKGKKPIKVKAEFLKEKVIRLASKDLDITNDYNTLEELQNYDNPADPLALHKAALVVTGVIPKKGCKTNNYLEKLLNEVGGIALTTMVDIPKGSGLGTSSILAGAVVKAIYELLQVKYDDQKLFDDVLCLEQILTTGGGWQDQVGGLIPGIKLVTSTPGNPQKISVAKVNLSKKAEEELRERLVLVYTGQRRLAKNILRELMGEYIINNPVSIEALNEIQKLAVLMKHELEKGNIDEFAKLLNTHWEINKKLDKGCTNTYIDQIFQVCNSYVSGGTICGAGGGGFMHFILKRGKTKDDLQNKLSEIFQDNEVEIWDCSI